jgi:glutamate/tyrosine decarboxylase-like PLP-dependent enzyme
MDNRIKALPRTGRSADSVLETMQQARGEDARWRDGKVWSLVYNAGDETTELLKRAYTMFFSENALNPTAFPSLKRMEAEVVSMTAHLLGGDAHAVGNMTSGGTESILMAVKAAREWGRAMGRDGRVPEIVAPVSAHPAFDKAAHYFGMKIVHVPLGPDYRVDMKKMRRAISRRTVLLVGSAPQYPHGPVDPIEQIGALAQRHGILCHVDACVGGFMLPFVRELGYPVPPFDLRVPGVTSMSVDLHKYAYAAKPASVVLYRSPELRKHQFFAYTGWPGGIYVSPTMTGSRPGGAIAAAWAIMHYLGHEGYLEIAREVMATRDKLVAGIRAIEGLEVLGEPTMSVMGIGAKRPLDIYEIGDHMSERGWHMDRQQQPNSLHLTINRGHLSSADAFLDDLREAVRLSQRDQKTYYKQQMLLTGMNAALRVIPAPLVTRLTKAASKAMGLGGGQGDGLPKRTAAMYGMMASLPNKGDLDDIAVDILDGLTRFDPKQRIEPDDQEEG